MKNKNMILPILASIGVGAATYYSMRNKDMGNMMSNMTKTMNQHQ
ncbi:hypothetical protein [Paraliobacillus salinarum]|nr:hypothetical protein [Paraliobacillus salinarum]